MNEDYNINVMEAFFKGKLDNKILHKPKIIEIGYGKGIGYMHGTYSQYINRLSKQTAKGNGFIYIGKSINAEKEPISPDKDIFSIPETTDTFFIGDIPKILIMFYDMLNDTIIKLTWKDSNNDIILEQYYEIPSAHSMGYDWWNSYGVYFVGPEKLDEGNYKIEITSTSFGVEDKKKILNRSLKFTVIERPENNDNITKK